MSRRLSLTALLCGLLALTTYAAGPTFRPDTVFRGNALTGWTPLGQADWRAQNGEIVGTPRQPGGGWLVLNKSYQDVAVYTNVTCTAGCKAGVLMRAEKTPDGGMKGIYVSLTEGDLSSYSVTLERAGCRDGASAAAIRSRGRCRRRCRPRRRAAVAVVQAEARHRRQVRQPHRRRLARSRSQARRRALRLDAVRRRCRPASTFRA